MEPRMNVLVTGGLGVIGSWVTRRLVDVGLRPKVIDRRPDFSLLGEAYRDRIDFQELDLLDTGAVAGFLAGNAIDGIAHLAAAVGHGAVEANPKAVLDVNLTAVIALLEAACRAGTKRFVFASSRSVYGNISGPCAHPVYEPISETGTLAPNKLYDHCKVMCESAGGAFADAHGLEFTALRFGSIFGPGKMARHRNFGLLSRIIESPALDQPVKVEHGGDQREDMIFVGDAARGVVAALLAETLASRSYNIATGKGRTLNDLADAVRHYFPQADISIGPGLDIFGVGSNSSGILDTRRARDELGFTAEDDLVTSVGKYYEAMRELGMRQSKMGAST